MDSKRAPTWRHSTPYSSSLFPLPAKYGCQFILLIQRSKVPYSQQSICYLPYRVSSAIPLTDPYWDFFPITEKEIKLRPLGYPYFASFSS